MTETQGNKRYVNYHMPLIISIINYTIVHVNWTKIICLIQQSIDSYKCNAMRTASELRTMNTNCTSICFPGSLHNLSFSVSGHTWNLHLQGVSGLLDAAVDDPTCMSGTIHSIWNSYSIVGHPVEPFGMVLRVQECMRRMQERARREGTSPSSSSPLLNFSTSHSAVKQ